MTAVLCEDSLAEAFDELRPVTEYGLHFRAPQPGEVPLFLVPEVSAGPIEDLDPRTLVCTQEAVPDLAVKRWAAEQHVPPALVLSINGELYILDGHHRACAAVSMGRSLPCLVARV